MANIILNKSIQLDEKIKLMQEDARFDVADNEDENTSDLSFLRDDIKSKPPLPKVPKVFLTNDCIFNCAYCGCRSSNECKRRYEPNPRELAEHAVKQANGNGHGIFITSSIYKNADYTEELIIKTLQIIRNELKYHGYIHAKVMPGTNRDLIYQAGLYANRLSVNIEVAKNEGYAKIARNKNKQNILTPMSEISELIQTARAEKSLWTQDFATSQTTQLMAGSTNEDDKTILTLSDTLYRKYHLKRVYYTAFQYKYPAAGYDDLQPVSTPQWRMRRLYQADRLMQLYGFTANEITPDDSPYLQSDMDPKAAWALRNLHLFPVEVNKADYEMLLRVPGIGVTYASRIIKARKFGTVNHAILKSIGVSLKRCNQFITCNGKFQGISTNNKDAVYQILADSPRVNENQQLSFQFS